MNYNFSWKLQTPLKLLCIDHRVVPYKVYNLYVDQKSKMAIVAVQNFNNGHWDFFLSETITLNLYCSWMILDVPLALHKNGILIWWIAATTKQILGARVAQWVRSLDLTTHTSLWPIWHGFAPSFVNYKGCTRLAATSDKVYQLLAHVRWFSPGTPASSTTKTGRHDTAEILLKVALEHQKSINRSKF
jgi:hypothetical protein